MDAVTSTSPTPAATGTTTTGAAPASTDYQTYLEMLTVQLKNQDPLNPMEADDFAVQLATFSMVEQQAYSNSLLDSILGQLSASSLAQMSAWVGMEARGSFPAQFSGNPIEIYLPHAVYGDTHQLVVTDSNGDEVRRLPVIAQGEIAIWDGTDAAGLPVDDGTYGFRLDSFEGEELVSSGAVETYSIINEVRMTSAGIRLVTQGDVEVDPAQVSALRTPGDGGQDSTAAAAETGTIPSGSTAEEEPLGS